jgi:NAD(P)-dependent dehydrogenase (short-subunit alcohol dehydrogenase family)
MPERVVAITGGARGIGLATAEELRCRGVRVAVGDLDDQPGVHEVDVTDPASFARFVADVERDRGPLDVLVNNAGIMPIGPFLDETHDTARKVMDVNVLGCIAGMKVALPGMLERGSGHIVNVASIAGRAPAPGGVTYCASKAAIIMLTEAARVEYAGSGVSFTCVMPSFTATELIAGTRGTRFVATVSPKEVAVAIADAIEAPRADVYVPRSVGHIARFNALAGRRVRDGIARRLGADRTFLDVDHGARGDYEQRIGGR